MMEDLLVGRKNTQNDIKKHAREHISQNGVYSSPASWLHAFILEFVCECIVTLRQSALRN